MMFWEKLKLMYHVARGRPLIYRVKFNGGITIPSEENRGILIIRNWFEGSKK